MDTSIQQETCIGRRQTWTRSWERAEADLGSARVDRALQDAPVLSGMRRPRPARTPPGPIHNKACQLRAADQRAQDLWGRTGARLPRAWRRECPLWRRARRLLRLLLRHLGDRLRAWSRRPSAGRRTPWSRRTRARASTTLRPKRQRPPSAGARQRARPRGARSRRTAQGQA
eukprot:3830668-Rhodomonas_salina.1